jgi:hypothetical protein
MINVLTLFPKSADLKAIEDFISSQMIPTLKQVHGLRSLKLSVGDLMSPVPPAYSKVVEASFDSMDDWWANTQTPEAQAEKEFMISVGCVMLFYEVTKL